MSCSYSRSGFPSQRTYALLTVCFLPRCLVTFGAGVEVVERYRVAALALRGCVWGLRGLFSIYFGGEFWRGAEGAKAGWRHGLEGPHLSQSWGVNLA